MAKMTPQDLKELASHHFERQRRMLSLWQTIADHFYPERADFTITHNVGDELADNLVDSYPILVRRDLGNSFESMLRDGKWFELTVNEGEPGYEGKRWLESARQRLYRLMQDRRANFVRATREGDHDFATFGQLVMSVEINRKHDGLLFRTWHLRDCTWWDDETGQVGGVIRKWKPPVYLAMQYFGEKKLHRNMVDAAKDSRRAFKNGELRHFEIPADLYGDEQIQQKFDYVSVWLDCDNEHIIEEVGQRNRSYVVPRFQTISGSPFAYSPATVAGLPDARCLQAMTHTLLEAGERFSRPPLIGKTSIVRSDVDLAADGITWIDSDYDERLGDALRPMMQDRGGFPIGEEMRNKTVETLSSAFYLNKLTLPEASHDMTAYEVQERMKQYRRETLPLFSPIEAEYNGQICEHALSLAMEAGLMGSPYDIPTDLRDKEVEFKFKSPLTESEEEAKVSMFRQTAEMLGATAEMDPAVISNVNFDTAFRDALSGLGAPTKWLNSLESVMQGRMAQKLREQAEQTAEMQSASEGGGGQSESAA